jgi:hypothetical protein
VIVLTCDVCKAPADFSCACARCAREYDLGERFHACKDHLADVMRGHVRVRGQTMEPVRRGKT